MLKTLITLYGKLIQQSLSTPTQHIIASSSHGNKRPGYVRAENWSESQSIAGVWSIRIHYTYTK